MIVYERLSVVEKRMTNCEKRAVVQNVRVYSKGVSQPYLFKDATCLQDTCVNKEREL